MKKLVKIISIVLAIALVGSTVFSTAIFASAAEPAKITGLTAEASGTWVNPNTSGLSKLFDGNTSTSKWNPQAQNLYAGDPGVIIDLGATYDVSKIVITFGNNMTYSLSTSLDKTAWTPYSTDATGTVVTLNDLTITAKYVKITLSARDGSNTASLYVNFFEFEAYGTKAAPKITGITAESTGNWVNPNASGLANLIDGNLTTKWNPQANTDYAGNPGVILTLPKIYEISKLHIMFGNDMTYNLEISTDKETWTPFATNAVSKDITVGSLALVAKYIKITISARDGGASNLYVNFFEVEAYGNPYIPKITGLTAEPCGEFSDPPSTGNNISAIGNLVDDDTSTKWNPSLKDFSGNNGVIIDLGAKYNVEKIAMLFGNDMTYTLSSSKDGESWTDVKKEVVGKEVSIEGIMLEATRYLRVTFTARDGAKTNSYVNFFEFSAFGESYSDPAITMTAEPCGQFAGSPSTGDNIAAIGNLLDGNTTTKWNPALANFNGENGVIFDLGGRYNVSELKFLFGNDMTYNLATSKDKIKWTDVDADAVGKDITLEGLEYTDVRYIKMTFTARDGATSNTYLNFFEASAKGVPYEDPKIADVTAEPCGSFAGSPSTGDNISAIGNLFDNNTSTKWNPAVADFSGNNGVIFDLGDKFDVSKITMLFGNSMTFDLETSADKTNWTKQLDDETGTDVKLTNLEYTNVRYIKVTFSARDGATTNTYVNFFEFAAFGTETPTPPRTGDNVSMVAVSAMLMLCALSFVLIMSKKKAR